ncbi:Os08g0468300 [Oryza sativa Japonica Group]|uniref:Os08g0468300 protein n=2 Tax=Oryza sativa subsp. japonica TaxID=39947 RepID=C7J5U0_ORYSJ|nr:hypothetical protein EE612_044810 [Oryza sativa]BAH94344.1 Os08g0468300 [Oryza sativa Japonica Group]BAT05818.1 Os08g0468300 [Oryza sativa Japonica Group]|eukprot:NP_001175616.1 Os08g0468300 [Oryza sativa Japonica Group]
MGQGDVSSEADLADGGRGREDVSVGLSEEVLSLTVAAGWGYVSGGLELLSMTVATSGEMSAAASPAAGSASSPPDSSRMAMDDSAEGFVASSASAWGVGGTRQGFLLLRVFAPSSLSSAATTEP